MSGEIEPKSKQAFTLRISCQWCHRRTHHGPPMAKVFRGRDGPFHVCPSCLKLAQQMRYEVTE